MTRDLPLIPAALVSAFALMTACASNPAAPAAVSTDAPAGPAPYAVPARAEPAGLEPYFAAIEVVPGQEAPRETVTGVVFHDLNRDGRRQPDEPGIEGILVSNGLDVVRTGADGQYELPVRADMSVSVVQPRGWRTPTDETWIPQFAYEHKPAGSPKPLRFGGLPPTGPLPEAINFPLIPSPVEDNVRCLIIGDSQTYNNIEIGYIRDSLVRDVANAGPAPHCAIFVGDVMGDDLGLMPRFQAVGGALRAPQYYVHGNHDFDFDADFDADSADSWRRLFGPAYYAFEIGDNLFISLDNVVYPCGPEDAALEGRDFCLNPDRKMYNGRVTEEQMTWLANLLDLTPASQRIVFLHHIPFVSFSDHTSTQHQTDNAPEIYDLVSARQAISFSGHTHTLEVFEPGDAYAGWSDAVGVDAVPFRHVIAGAASGGWWNGDFDADGVPMSISRLGEPRGYMVFETADGDYSLDFVPLGTSRERRMALSINTPPFRHWMETILDWRAEPAETRDPVPPYSINDLPDVKLLTPEDLAGGAWITANVWQASSGAEVTISIQGGEPVPMEPTQLASGEAPQTGPDFADPYAVMRQLSVSRVALQSRSDNPATQGIVAGRRTASGAVPPQPSGPVADRSTRLWRYTLPADLAPGTYTATIEARLPGEHVLTDRMIFEVVTERPQPDWRADVWNAFENGPPVW